MKSDLSGTNILIAKLKTLQNVKYLELCFKKVLCDRVEGCKFTDIMLNAFTQSRSKRFIQMPNITMNLILWI